MNLTGFVSWLKEEMDRRGMSQSDFAEAGGEVSDSMVSQVINLKTKPGKKFYLATARAFNVSVDDVMKHAGELAKGPDETTNPTLREIWDHLLDMDPQTRKEVRNYVRYLHQQTSATDGEMPGSRSATGRTRTRTNRGAAGEPAKP